MCTTSRSGLAASFFLDFFPLRSFQFSLFPSPAFLFASALDPDSTETGAILKPLA